MNDLDVLTDRELDVVSGGDKPIVVATNVLEIGLTHGSEIHSALEAAGSAIGTGTRP
jgi:hypothetical protein